MIAWLETLVQDVRFALRSFRKSPGFTATAILTLAIGIGGTTAIFTLIHQVLLQSLPVSKPDELWRVGDAVLCCHSNGYTQGDNNDWSFFTWETYKLFRTNTVGFENLAAFQVGNTGLGVRRHGSSEPVSNANGEFVSGNFFETFGIPVWRGRLFTDADDQEGAPPVAVMSFHTWKGKYGSDQSVIGATYQINGHPFTVVGVTPPGFFGAKVTISGMPDFWLPLTTEPVVNGESSRLKNTGEAWLDLIGRARPGANPKTLEAQLQVELHQWLASHLADMSSQEKAFWEKQTLHLTPGGAGVSLMRENYKDGLRLLLATAFCVLLVVCANIANLLLARGLRNRHEAVVCVALGASRARLVRKGLVGSLTLAVLGAVAGVAVAYVGASHILHLAFAGPDNWSPVDAAPSITVLLFALGISVATAVAFGIAPAWMTSRVEPIEVLRGANRFVGASRHWVQKSLVIAQVAVSLVLLSAAAMLSQSLRNLEHQDFGFETNGRYLVSINTMLSNYKQEQLAALFHAIQERLRAIPNVHMASPELYAPLTGFHWSHEIRIDGKPDPENEDDASSDWTRVTPGFFETLGTRIVAGRPIAEEDSANTRSVAVINEAFAKQFFGKESPIGQHFGPAPRKNARSYEVVGVASNMRYFSDTSDSDGPMYFLPEAQTTRFDEAHLESREVWSHYLYSIVIWAGPITPEFEVQVKRALGEVDPNLIVYGVQPYSEVIHTDFSQQNMIANLTALFGITGLLLAAVGLYGVTAYTVEQRTSEIGVRMALGADTGSVMFMVLREALWQVSIGLALGIPAALGAGYLIANQLFAVAPWDPVILFGAALLLTLAALIAATIPARRAMKVDPMVALRYE